MDLVIQLLMGMSLAACAGLRAWMPLLVVGLLGRFGALHLNQSFDLLSHTSTLIVLGAATVIEILGDKVIVVDHFLDAAGTVLRPAAGTVLAASMFWSLDPALSLALGLIAGGGTALTVHAGKSAARVGTSALAPAHAGAGNALVSLFEDVVTLLGVLAAVFVPILAFVVIGALVVVAFRMIRRARSRRPRFGPNIGR
jgi:hypothetical protein